jgi:hypothetical protein
VLTHDSLTTYVADRQRARMDAAQAFRTGRLLRRARGLMASGLTGSAATAAPAPAVPVPTSSPVVAHATGPATGTTGAPAVTGLRTTVTAGAPEAA